jgi:hypothetical protein
MEQTTNKELFCKQENGLSVTVYKIGSSYHGVITDSFHSLWRKDFTCPETATKKSLRVFNEIILTGKYLSLSEKYYNESRYYESMEDEKEAAVYLAKAFVYKEKYYTSKGLKYFS